MRNVMKLNARMSVVSERQKTDRAKKRKSEFARHNYLHRSSGIATNHASVIAIRIAFHYLFPKSKGQEALLPCQKVRKKEYKYSTKEEKK